ncbi:MAG: hypothetical protein V4501_07915 [Pseudomonadota bacterium]
MSLARPILGSNLTTSSSFQAISLALSESKLSGSRPRSASLQLTTVVKPTPDLEQNGSSLIVSTRPRTFSDDESKYHDVEGFNESRANDLRQIFYTNMHRYAPLAEAYRFDPQDILMFIFVVGCAGSGLPLYIIGSASHEKLIDLFGLEINLYPVGAAYANFLQNALYAYCFAKAARNFQNENKLLLMWSVGWGVITAYVPTAAMFRMGFKKNYSLPATFGLTISMFLSTFPLSFFAMYETTLRIMKSFNDNPQARKFLYEQLYLCAEVQSDPRKRSIMQTHNSEFLTNLGFYLGIGIGVSQVLSIEPWVCDSEKSFEENWGLPILLSWVLSADVFNLPNLLIAGTFTGFDQGDLLVNLAYKSSRYLTGQERYFSTLLETIADTGLLFATILTIQLCMYSSMTSVDMVDECPSAGPLLDLLIRTNVDWGTIWGNFVMTMFTVVMIFKVSNPLREMRDWITGGPIEEIEAAAEVHFPNSRLEWQRPTSTTTSPWLSRIPLLGQNRSGTESIHLLNQEEEDAEREEKGQNTSYSSFGLSRGRQDD